ncbi:hypothetical protein [Aeoliella mucimassa]|uniref:EF-hand domain-containing protein n=1 Tax=Aeoliella mucimassa TaxID=2527972 RepID=A0A518AH72_9BACT|nr:hypothetical protein [Aeoliella mucimassa]QDU54081.1 hypothetical protein Pan181_02610 [Aeoliella mucimassa]
MTLLHRMALIALLLPAAFASVANAHQLDECVQSALVEVAPGEVLVWLNLSPGVEVAEQLIGLIDQNSDGSLTEQELQQYADLLLADLDLALDSESLHLRVDDTRLPELEELQSGWGVVQLKLSAPLPKMPAGEHLLRFENRHLPAVSVYLFNAAQPTSSQVSIAKQTRNENQSEGKIRFAYHPVVADEPTTALQPITVGIVIAIALSAWCVVRLRSLAGQPTTGLAKSST